MGGCPFGAVRHALSVTIGSLDAPEDAAIERRYGVESKLPWVRFCAETPQERTGADPKPAAFFAALKSRQG